MKLDNVKRIVTEDFSKDDQELASRIGTVLNSFMEQVVNTVNGNISIENMDREFVTLTKVNVNSSGVPFQKIQFSSTKSSYESHNVIHVINTTNPSKLLNSRPYVTFASQGNGLYTVRHVTGLVSGDEYTIKLELIP